MNVRILSDLHLEFESFEPPETDADVVVLAGDVHVGRNGLKWALRTFPHVPVLYVLGNHEFYGQALPKLTHTLIEEAETTNVYLLENNEWIYEGVRFLGCTLWTDFRLFGDPVTAAFAAQQAMNDFKKIRSSPRYNRLSPADTVREHAGSLLWLKQKFKENFNGPTVVISHHAPSSNSVPPQWNNHVITAAFASDLTEFILDYQPDIWIHGHLHTVSDYRIGTTRVICNPRGYPNERVDNFDPALIVNI